MKGSRRPPSYWVIFGLSIALLAVGLVLTVTSFYSVRQTMYESHDSHVMDVAHAIDHNVYSVLDRYHEELSGFIAENVRLGGEEALLSGNKEETERLARRAKSIFSDYAEDVLITKDGVPLFTMSETDPADYSFPLDGSVRLCHYAPENNNFLALGLESGGFTYYILTDLEDFYRRVVTDSIFENAWIILYDAKSGLALQNDISQPEYGVFTAEEMLSRKDGYSLVRKYRDLGVIGAESYLFKGGAVSAPGTAPQAERGQSGPVSFSAGGTNPQKDGHAVVGVPNGADPASKESFRFVLKNPGVGTGYRILVIPDMLSENNIFTIGISVLDETIVRPVRHMTLRVGAAALSVSVAIAAIIFCMVHNGRREKEGRLSIKCNTKHSIKRG